FGPSSTRVSRPWAEIGGEVEGRNPAASPARDRLACTARPQAGPRLPLADHGSMAADLGAPRRPSHSGSPSGRGSSLDSLHGKAVVGARRRPQDERGARPVAGLAPGWTLGGFLDGLRLAALDGPAGAMAARPLDARGPGAARLEARQRAAAPRSHLGDAIALSSTCRRRDLRPPPTAPRSRRPDRSSAPFRRTTRDRAGGSPRRGSGGR